MSTPAAGSLGELIERISTWPYGMPVRAMEQVLAMGETIVPELVDALARWQDDEERDALWLVVLLGQARHPSATAALVDQIRKTDRHDLAQAAAEGLAKIGAAAVPPLIELARTGSELERLAAYITLGWIPDDRGYASLIEALGRDRRLVDVIALSLGEQGRPEAMAALEAAYGECEPWQRPEIEGALHQLHHRTPPDPSLGEDWRLRFRRVPQMGYAIQPDLLSVYAVVHANESTLGDRPIDPPRALEEILAGEIEAEEPDETCPECGATLESYTGLPACPETAVSTAVFQLRLLSGARDDGIEDLFELLDEVEADEGDRLDAGEPRGPKARERWREEVNELEMCRETCVWLIEQGAESVGQAKAMLLAEAGHLAGRFGDPERLLAPVQTVRLAAPKIGRNDPCPCGSGRKYKHCCLDKA